MERLHLERNIASSKSIEANFFFFCPGGLYCAIYLVKGKQLFAGDALLLSSGVLLPELGRAGFAEISPPSEGNQKAPFP